MIIFKAFYLFKFVFQFNFFQIKIVSNEPLKIRATVSGNSSVFRFYIAKRQFWKVGWNDYRGLLVLGRTEAKGLWV